MATLSPLAMLILYIALAAAPSSAKQVIAKFSLTQRMVFTRQADELWLKRDDLGNAVYWKTEKAKLIVRGGTSNSVEELNLLNSFALTGQEDWSKPTTVLSKAEKMEVRTTPKQNGITVTVFLSNEKSQECSIEWYESDSP